MSNQNNATIKALKRLANNIPRLLRDLGST